MKASCLLYRNLSLFRGCVQYRRINFWWMFVAKKSSAFKSVSCIIALLCGTQPNGYGENFGSRQRCQLCCNFVVETMEHIIFECPELHTKRMNLIDELINEMPQGMKESFDKMNWKAKTEFILTGLGSGTYIHEWQEIYLKASRLIHTMYSERSRRYKMNQI